MGVRLQAEERSPWNARFWTGFVLCGLVLALLVPLLNRWVAPDSPFAVPDYLVPLLGKYLCYAILGKIAVLVAIILFIQWRPRGLFALRGRTAEAEG